MFFPPQPPSGLSAHELHTRRLMVRSVSWLTLRSLFATAETSRRAHAQMGREFDERSWTTPELPIPNAAAQTRIVSKARFGWIPANLCDLSKR